MQDACKCVQVNYKTKTSVLSCIFAKKMQKRALKSAFRLICANYKQVRKSNKKRGNAPLRSLFLCPKFRLYGAFLFYPSIYPRFPFALNVANPRNPCAHYPRQRAFTLRTSMCVKVLYIPIPPLFFRSVSAYAATFFGVTPFTLISAALP